MFINNFDPVAINFFSLEIRWYSLAYIFGILAGWVLAKRFFINNQGIKIKFDDYVFLQTIRSSQLHLIVHHEMTFLHSKF